ncbi:MAG: S8 family serine peptidase [Elusimicrobiota bacterium]
MEILKKFFITLILCLIVPGSLYALERELFLTPEGRQVEVEKNAIIVKYKKNMSSAVKRSIEASAGVRYAGGMKKLGIERVQLQDGTTLEEALEKFLGMDNVIYAEPVYLRKASKLPLEYSDINALKNRQWALEKVNAPEAWELATGGETVVAVLDTGIDLDHPELVSNMWVNPSPDTVCDTYFDSWGYTYSIKYDTNGWNFVGDNNDPDDDNVSSGGHGTHCAGIIAARANTSTYTIVGMSWFNKLMAVKTLNNIGWGTDWDIIYGIVYAADRGADVISMSFGGTDSSQAEEDAVNYAYEKGCVLVAASGNDGSRSVDFPAAYNNVIAVGASSSSDTVSDFSNYGTAMDLVAPGETIYSTYIGGYGNLTGTSMACPLVAGLASLVISYWEGHNNAVWTPQQVRNIMTSNCDDINSTAYLGWDKYAGYGRMNAERTLQFLTAGAVKIDEEKVLVYPNPFNPGTQRSLLVLPRDYGGTIKKLRIYSIDGQEVREVGGSGSVVYWDGKNNDGEMCSSGLYFYFLDTTVGSRKGKITLIR